MVRKDLERDLFEAWLAKKNEEILSKIGREKISTEEVLILIFRDQ